MENEGMFPKIEEIKENDSPEKSISELGQERRKNLVKKIGPTLNKLLKWGTVGADMLIGGAEVLSKEGLVGIETRLNKNLMGEDAKLKDTLAKIQELSADKINQLKREALIYGYSQMRDWSEAKITEIKYPTTKELENKGSIWERLNNKINGLMETSVQARGGLSKIDKDRISRMVATEKMINLV